MTKAFCDRCKNETRVLYNIKINDYLLNYSINKEVCEECFIKVKNFLYGDKFYKEE